MVVSQFSHIQRNPHNMRMDVNEEDPQEIHSQLLCGVIMAVVGGVEEEWENQLLQHVPTHSIAVQTLANALGRSTRTRTSSSSRRAIRCGRFILMSSRRHCHHHQHH